MVLKVGIDQWKRSDWQFSWDDERWISADYVNVGPPTPDKIIKEGTLDENGKQKFNYGFNDFVIAECTPNMAYQVHGALQSLAELPPDHPRAETDTTATQGRMMARALAPNADKHRTGYRTMAYGWGQLRDVFNTHTTVNEYAAIEGPEAPEMSGEPFVRFVMLPIPGGLSGNNAFWIDLNKGLRALYFPARYVYSNDYPNDASWAKISFVEEGGGRYLIDAKQLKDQGADGTFGAAVNDLDTQLEEATRTAVNTTKLNEQYHIGAYSFDSTLIVNIPKFIDACFMVSMDPTAAPHDALYLAKAADITAKPYKIDGWQYPDCPIAWKVGEKTMKSYAGQVGKAEQIHLQEVTLSKLGGWEEFGLNLLVFAASLVPYIGPLLVMAGTEGIKALKDVQIDSSEEKLKAAGISSDVWNSLPSEAKETFLNKLAKEVPKVLKLFKKR
ncbi:hypothetical protein BJY01DRAFT_248375 [Aspergillus pseudoustus]|uniref:Uncharacterized protein n=1 Tax=Aspergillus pseudoustus TaxID=1810923 RepID=A0ABR4JY08_9EURO